jgi:hypothetical protein
MTALLLERSVLMRFRHLSVALYAACASIAIQLWPWVALSPPAAAQSAAHTVQDVVTYHGDNLRTGWFSSETQLTALDVSPKTFGLLARIALDGRVDAEPLVVAGQSIDGQGVHNTL